MTTQIFELRIGDSLVPLDAELFRKNASGVSEAANLTGHSVVFTMVNAVNGLTVIDSDAVTIITAASGLVRYQWDAADIVTAGIYRGTFRDTAAAKSTSFPIDPTSFEIWIHGQNQTAAEAYAAARAGE